MYVHLRLGQEGCVGQAGELEMCAASRALYKIVWTLVCIHQNRFASGIISSCKNIVFHGADAARFNSGFELCTLEGTFHSLTTSSSHIRSHQLPDVTIHHSPT